MSPHSSPRPALPREIWVLAAAALLIALGYGLVSPVLPQFARSFDVSVAAASFVVSAFSLCRLVFAPAGGALVTRLGERRVYLTGLLIVAASSLATALAQDYVQLLVFRGLGGIGSTMFTVSAMGLIVRLAPPTARGRASSLYATSFLLGNIGGPVLGGLLAELGLRVPFVVYAGALVIAAGVVWRLLPDTGRRGAARPKDEHPPMQLAEALRDSAFRAALVSGFANGWSNFGVRVALLPLFAAAALDAGPWSAGAALALFAVGNALALNVAGRRADQRGRKPLVLVGLLVSGVFTAVLGLSGNVAVVLVVSALAGVGAGLLNPAQQATVADVVGQERSGGKVLAGFQMSQDTGAILGPVLAGALADAFGYGVAFAVSGAITLLAGVAWLGARETLEHAPRR
ncbi:MFS transporter [uncultured Georgenia sp.]|uniref:MFS transporter n=1 Tax=uncultured Georgenia sp. TaxID=378209 RepID=UPI00260B75DF|nr:MFS transporter [uncultured Georgenia sp.]HLV04528.1 MFS transporter [Actinomycetaceae bacterium]